MKAVPLVQLHWKYPILEPTKEANNDASRNKYDQHRLRVAKELDVVEARRHLLTTARCL